jgi:RNase P subunit RPR2
MAKRKTNTDDKVQVRTKKRPECESCQQTLTEKAVLTLPWEDGNNRYAYVRCPWCGHKNTVYGYGEDD